MTFRFLLTCLLAWLPLVAYSGVAWPQQSPVPRALGSAADWPLETLRLRDGRILRGLILVDRPEQLEFVEIVRRPGQPLDAVLRFPDPSSVEQRQRLEAGQRALLLRRYQAIKHRVRIELWRMDQVPLDKRTLDGVVYHTYQGRWFRVWSTADEEMTRRSIVRIEQIVQAYRQLLPPRREGGSFRILLFGSMDEYAGYLQRLGLDISNPAFYSPAHNLIVAGSNLTRYAEQLRQVRRDNVAILRRYDQKLNPAFDKKLQERSRELSRRGGNPEEIALRRAAWQNEYTDLLRQITEINRRNDAKFAEVTQRMFTRFYHEAFHAYLENHVYPRDETSVPRWLNEGLAQVFEAGTLDADTLRIDAPDAVRLRELQQSLRDDPEPLARLLVQDHVPLSAPHAVDYSARQYVYAWGLAYYLSFHAGLLDPRHLDEYVGEVAAQPDPIARFEKLVRMPLDEFEPQWRQAMLRLQPPPEAN